MPISPKRQKEIEEENQQPPIEKKVTPTFASRASSRLMGGKRKVWKCPGCGVRHYYDPVDRCRLPCGYRGQFFSEVE